MRLLPRHSSPPSGGPGFRASGAACLALGGMPADQPGLLLGRAPGSVVMLNDSEGPWKCSLLPPSGGDRRGAGPVELLVFDGRAQALLSLGRLNDGEECLLWPHREVVLAPVSGSSLGAVLGMVRRPDLVRSFCLKDARGARVPFKLHRAGKGDPGPRLEFLNPEDAPRCRAVFLLRREAAQAWITILRDRLS